MKKTSLRLAAILLLALVLAAFSALSTAVDHDCDGADCPICALLDRCGRFFSLTCLPSSGFAHISSRTEAPATLPVLLCPALTLVVFRTRLNN
jgi:hypothetical protein